MIDETAPVPRPPTEHGVRLPIARPIVTYVLLAAIAGLFVVETLLGGSTSIRTLVGLGAQVNSLVAQGGYWRFLSSMFLHIGIAHIAFNAWALYSLGRDIEGLYGSLRFTVLYFISGLSGSIAYYISGPNAVSAGASGAVFGLVGAEIAFFLTNRRLFGSMGRQRLANLAILVAINLAFGFTAPGINNLAHMGGLVSGFVLGLVLTPRYEVTWALGSSGPTLVNRRSRWSQVLAVFVAVALLVAGVRLGNQRWAAGTQLPNGSQAAVRPHEGEREVQEITLHVGEVYHG